MKRPIKKSICDTGASPTKEKLEVESVEAHREENQKTGTHKHTEAAKKTTHTIQHVHANKHTQPPGYCPPHLGQAETCKKKTASHTHTHTHTYTHSPGGSPHLQRGQFGHSVKD